MPGKEHSVVKPILIALGSAAVVLIVAVLPAEYGVDPLGTGRLLGLTGLAEVPPEAVSVTEGEIVTDTVSYTLEPFESIELKYALAEGGGMVFAWDATGPVEFDMHSEPEGAKEGYAETFDIGTGVSRSGIYTAPFPGIHGWFWENRGDQPVTVSLTVTGFMTKAAEFRDGFKDERELKQE